MDTFALPELESYPKQEQLNTGPGSLVKASLGIHRKSGICYPFIDSQDRSPVSTVEENLEILAQPATVPAAFFERMLKRGQALQRADKRTHQLLSPIRSFTLHLRDQVNADQIKVAITVYNFVSRYVVLTPHGRGLCQFPENSHMSFSVHAQENF